MPHAGIESHVPYCAAMSRDLFPVTKNLIYLNHAAIGPLSTRAYEAMERHVRDQRDFGALHWREGEAGEDHLPAAPAPLVGAEGGGKSTPQKKNQGFFVGGAGLPM